MDFLHHSLSVSSHNTFLSTLYLYICKILNFKYFFELVAFEILGFLDVNCMQWVMVLVGVHSQGNPRFLGLLDEGFDLRNDPRESSWSCFVYAGLK